MAASLTRSTSLASDSLVRTARRRRAWSFVKPSVIPGFGVTLGLSLTYLALVVLIPLAGMAIRSAALGPAELWRLATDQRTVNALWVSFGSSLVAALVNVVFGLVVAWVLVRYSFRGRRLLDAIVDLPFALPTAVAGIALSTLYGPSGWIGAPLSHLGIKIAYTPAGIVIALIFIGLPFMVRTVQPVLEELEQELEEAAATLGANRLRTLLGVTMPLIKGGLVAALLIAFITSFDELTIAIFVSGGITTTLPKQMWDDMILQLNPTLAAVSVTVFVVVTSLFIIAERFRSSSQNL